MNIERLFRTRNANLAVAIREFHWVAGAIVLLSAHAAMCAIIPQSRLITWQAGVTGGIKHRSTIYKTLTPANSLAEINSAIANCPSNQVVHLSAGTYTLPGSVFVGRSGVTIRGDGPTQTILKFTGGTEYGNLTFGGKAFADPNGTEPANLRNWTGGYAQGTNQITLSSTAGLTPGTMLMLDQLEDLVYVNADGNDGYCNYCGRQAGRRSQLQIVTVTGVSGNQVEISPGLYMPNWSDRYSPQAWWIGGTVQMSGVEDLSVTNVSGAQFNVTFVNAQNCWARNANSYNSAVNHFRTYVASHIEIRHCYAYGTINAASQSYGVSWYWASDCLCEDNIFNKVTSPMLNGSATAGNVNAYNYATNQYYSQVPAWLIEGTGTHAGHSQYYLFEGNYIPNIYIDFIHGSGSHHTVFRNRITGWEPNKTMNTFPIAIQATNRFVNVVGNILGRSGYHNTYECAMAACGTDTAIYHIGYRDTGGRYPAGYDPTTYTTLIRLANFDYANNAILSDTNLPASFYLTSKPSWFGDRPWPPFDPHSPASASPTNIPAGYRFIFGTDPPGTSGYRPPPPENLREVKP